MPVKSSLALSLVDRDTSIIKNDKLDARNESENENYLPSHGFSHAKDVAP